MSAAHFLAIALLACGCATAGKDLGDVPIDAPKAIDSSQLTVDAPRMTDAPTDAPTTSMIDAPIVIDAMIDAAAGGICNGNAECTFAGECCFTLGGPGICVPGTPFAGSCIPN